MHVFKDFLYYYYYPYRTSLYKIVLLYTLENMATPPFRELWTINCFLHQDIDRGSIAASPDTDEEILVVLKKKDVLHYLAGSDTHKL